MKRLHLMWLPILGILTVACSVSNSLSAQQPPSDTVPVSMVVSVEARHGKEIPAVNNKEDVRVLEGKERLRVTDWVPLQGSQADLELLILIDDATGQTVASTANSWPSRCEATSSIIEEASWRCGQEMFHTVRVDIAV